MLLTTTTHNNIVAVPAAVVLHCSTQELGFLPLTLRVYLATTDGGILFFFLDYTQSMSVVCDRMQASMEMPPLLLLRARKLESQTMSLIVT